jgi:hypothetical protein
MNLANEVLTQIKQETAAKHHLRGLKRNCASQGMEAAAIAAEFAAQQQRIKNEKWDGWTSIWLLALVEKIKPGPYVEARQRGEDKPWRHYPSLWLLILRAAITRAKIAIFSFIR